MATEYVGVAANPDAAVLARLLDSAYAEFTTNGFQGTSIEAVARRAGAGKTTVYRHFRDKQALFRHVVQRHFGKVQMQFEIRADDPREPRLVLLDAARQIDQISSAPENVRLMRMLIGEAHRFPGLAHDLWLSLGADMSGPLRSYLSVLMARGILEPRDPDVLARMFLRMAVENFRSLLGAQPRLLRPGAASLLESAVDLFLRGALRQTADANFIQRSAATKRPRKSV